MWRWHPLTRWLAFAALLGLWYGLVGPLFLTPQPWYTVDLVRPWFMVQALGMPPVLLFWAGAVWGLVQDAFLGLPVGLMGMVWATEALFILRLSSLLNYHSLTGILSATLLACSLQWTLTGLLAWILNLAWHLPWKWALGDFLATWLVARLFLLWKERSRHVQFTRTTGTF